MRNLTVFILSWLIYLDALVAADQGLGALSAPKAISSSHINAGLPHKHGWSGYIRYFRSTAANFPELLRALAKPGIQRSEADQAAIHSVLASIVSDAAHSNWTPLEASSGLLNLGMNTEQHIYAGYFILNNDTDMTQTLIFENNASFTHALSLFRLDSPNIPPGYLGRSGLSSLDGPAVFNSRTAMFKIELSARSRTKVVFVLESYVALLEPKIFAPEQLSEYLLAEEQFISLATGFLACVLIYNLFLWIAFRDRLYLLYTGFVLMSLGFVLGTSGTLAKIIREYFAFEGDLGFTQVYPVLGLVAFGIAFGDAFNETLRYKPKLIFFRYIVMALVAFNFPCYLLAPQAALQIQSIVVGCFITYMLYGVIQAVKRGNHASRIFLAAWGTYLFSGMFNTLAYKGVIRPNFWTEWGAAIGLLIEGIGLSIAISFRLKRQEEELHRELQSAMNAKVLLTNDLVHRTTQPLRKAIRAIANIKNDLGHWEDSLLPSDMSWQAARAEHVWIAQQQKGKYQVLRQQVAEVEAGILHTEHTIEDIYALSGSDYGTGAGASLKDCWKQLLLRLSDSSMRADLERLKIQGDELPKFEVRNNPIILNLALEMIFKLWLATGHGTLYLNFWTERRGSVDELHIRVVQPFAPIATDLLVQLLKHINYILFPYGMRIEMSPTGWELRVQFSLPEIPPRLNHRNIGN